MPARTELSATSAAASALRVTSFQAKLFASTTASENSWLVYELSAVLGNGIAFPIRPRNATISCVHRKDVLIILKIDFRQVAQSVPAFGNVFTSWQSSVAADRVTALVR